MSCRVTENIKTVYVVGGDIRCQEMFRKRNKWWLVDNIEDADLVQFTGGADVSPMLYNEKSLPTTNVNTERDIYERDIFSLALSLGKATAGICRGGQFLHVMNGGRLWQDVDGHLGNHEAVFEENVWLDDYQNKNLKSATKSEDGRFQVTSTHHQMMKIPVCGNGNVLLTSSISMYKRSGDGEVRCVVGKSKDVECVYYSKTRSLCYQPHPEYVGPGDSCQAWYFSALENLAFKEGV